MSSLRFDARAGTGMAWPAPPPCTADPYTSAHGITAAEYAAHSNQAHAVFAVSILASLVSYGVFFIGSQGWGGWLRHRPRGVPLAFLGSGAATLAAGGYLALRVRYICAGSSGCDGAGFVADDLVQQQHLSISALLAVCGALELSHGLAALCCPADGGRPPPAAGPLGPLVHEWWCAPYPPTTTPCSPNRWCRCPPFQVREHRHDGADLPRWPSARRPPPRPPPSLLCRHDSPPPPPPGHPQAGPHNAGLHAVIGVALVLGGQAVTADKRAGEPGWPTIGPCSCPHSPSARLSF